MAKRTLKPKVGSGLSFHGSPCTKDCSGHRAGYKWQKNHLSQPSLSKSNSFNAGAAIMNMRPVNALMPAIRNTQTGQFQKFKKIWCFDF